MKKLLSTTGLVAVLALAGCGGSPSSGFTPPPVGPRPVAWRDGDPQVPACGTAVRNCKRDYTVHDRTTGVPVTLPITAVEYTPPTTDDYEIRANGYDGDGLPINSPYLAIPK